MAPQKPIEKRICVYSCSGGAIKVAPLQKSNEKCIYVFTVLLGGIVMPPEALLNVWCVCVCVCMCACVHVCMRAMLYVCVREGGKKRGGKRRGGTGEGGRGAGGEMKPSRNLYQKPIKKNNC